MSTFFDRITETPETREKATPAEIRAARSKLAEDTTKPIPDCVTDINGEWNWQNIQALTWVRLKKDKADLKFEEVENMIGLHNIREIVPEIYYFFWDVANRSDIESHWQRIFEQVDSFDTCSNCGRKKVASWNFCANCGFDFQSNRPREEPAENPTH